ncbi:hypothetical protein DFJ73DRAFT_627056, partial [Zopfochytrium polystomum]
EEITTIFVVGFPEDIHEREFQNMFTFAAGFEAATLKFPANFDADDGVPQYKKQIIGFAKFRTRLEALQARDHLSGRRVDAERGCILKAEIAKKNLHTKRGISQSTLQYPQILSREILNGSQLAGRQSGLQGLDFLALDAESDLATPTLLRSAFSPATADSGPADSASSRQPSELEFRPPPSRSIQLRVFTLKPSPPIPNSFHKYQTGIPSSNPRGLATFCLRHGPSSSPLLAEASPSTAFGPGYRSLADQNPPCNTLYVGNLPPNASETELRDLFTRCIGYKRLSFRVRPNGPMCFVEFDDVQYAQTALNELHGYPLSNSMKGGIRLSFSKNPLGVRQMSLTPVPQTSSPGTQVVQPSTQQVAAFQTNSDDSGRLVFSF